MASELQTMLCVAFGPSTWATWAAAIGTFGAALAAYLAARDALKIADLDRKEREDANLLIAKLTAAKLAPLLERDARSIQHASRELVFADPAEAPPGLNREVVLLHTLRTLHYAIPSGDLAALVPLGENCAGRIAKAYSLLNLTMKEMENFIHFPDGLKDNWNGTIAEAQDLLAKAAATCTKYTPVEHLDSAQTESAHTATMSRGMAT